MFKCDHTYEDQWWYWDHENWMGYANGMDTIYLGSSSNPTLCMDVAGGPQALPYRYENYMPVQAYECNGNYAANQQWSFSN